MDHTSHIFLPQIPLQTCVRRGIQVGSKSYLPVYLPVQISEPLLAVSSLISVCRLRIHHLLLWPGLPCQGESRSKLLLQIIAMAIGTLELRGEQAPITLLAEFLWQLNAVCLSRSSSLQLGPSRGDRELVQSLNQLLSIRLPVW